MAVCKNSLTIFGSKEQIKLLKEHAKDGDEVFSIGAVIKEPEELLEITKKNILNPQTVQKFGAMNIKSWRYKNWGCYNKSSNSRVISEQEIDQSKLRGKMLESMMTGKLTEDESIERAKELIDATDYAMGIYFETDETPIDAIRGISQKYDKILFHLGYDSETEDVSGWIGLRNGEVHGHKHYDDCLSTIKMVVSPFDMHKESNN